MWRGQQPKRINRLARINRNQPRITRPTRIDRTERIDRIKRIIRRRGWNRAIRRIPRWLIRRIRRRRLQRYT